MLEGVDLALERREFACVVGPNGGGKTTLLKLVLGLLKPSRGRVRVFGGTPEEARPRVGYVPQSYAYDAKFPVRVKDVVLMGRLERGHAWGPYGREDRKAAHDALEQVGMREMGERPLSALSGGQRQRMLVARAIVGDRELLLLDEPTSNLDVGMEGELYELLKELNARMTIMMVSHDVGFVSSFVTKVICVRGDVVTHPTSEVTGEMISQMYGCSVRMVRHDHVDGRGRRDA